MRIKFLAAVLALAFLFAGFNTTIAEDKVVNKEVKVVKKAEKKEKMKCEMKSEKNCCKQKCCDEKKTKEIKEEK